MQPSLFCALAPQSLGMYSMTEMYYIRLPRINQDKITQREIKVGLKGGIIAGRSENLSLGRQVSPKTSLRFRQSNIRISADFSGEKVMAFRF